MAQKGHAANKKDKGLLNKYQEGAENRPTIEKPRKGKFSSDPSLIFQKIMSSSPLPKEGTLFLLVTFYNGAFPSREPGSTSVVLI